MKRRTREAVLLWAGGVLSLFILSLSNAGDPGAVPYIQIIAPIEGQAGNAFTLLGKNFDPMPASNTIQFELPTGNLTAPVTSASDTVLTGIVPEGVEPSSTSLLQRIYRVTVTTDQGTSNGVGFTPEYYDAPLILHPSWQTNTYVLLAPGSGRSGLVCGGGTPPYTLLPLSEQEQSIGQVELVDTVVWVTGLQPGRVRIKIQDSSNPPQSLWPSNVYVREPTFSPPFNLGFHTLLAGAAPAFTVTSSTWAGHMQTEQIELRLENAEIDLSALYPGYTLGLSEVKAWGSSLYQYFEVTDVNEIQANISVVSFEEGGADVVASGKITRDPPALIFSIPGQRGGSVVQGSYGQDLIFFDELVSLPQTPGETFSVTATYASVSVTEDDYLPMQHSVTRTFTTTGPTVPALRIERLLPNHGEAGRYVRIRGTGFGANSEDHQVTFAGAEETRVPARIHRIQAGQIMVPVPINAVTGPVRVALNGQSSNDYLFEVCFRPVAGIFFTALKAGTPSGPVLIVEQPPTHENAWRPSDFADEIPFASASFTLQAGSLNLSGLTTGQAVGVCQVDDIAEGESREYEIWYDGQEPEAPKRHVFKVSWVDTIYASPGQGGVGVRFDLVENLGQTMTIRFEQPIYRAPATPGAHVNTRSEVISEPWKGIPFSQMRVTQQGIVRVQ